MATKYLVLERVAEGTTGDGYEILASGVEASGAHHAIRQVAMKRPTAAASGVYVAVPTSNWTEETVTVEPREPILRIGGVAGQVTLDEALADEDAKGGD